MPSSKVITKVIDTNLFFGSADRFRDFAGGFYILTGSKTGTQAYSTVAKSTNTYSPIYEITDNSTGMIGINRNIYLDNYFLFSRISTSDPKFLNDRDWRNYAVDKFELNSTFFDHTTQILLPATRDDEAISNKKVVSSETTYIKSEYYRSYGRYQSNLSNVASEHLLPNYYFLKSQGIADLDIAKMITLDGTIGDDYFNYVGFTNELFREQQSMITSSAIRAGDLGGTTADRLQNFVNFVFQTEVSDPESGFTNTLFSNIASDKGVPRYSYNNIKDYLNVSYVNHTYQESTAQRLQTRLQNIMFLNPRVLNENNSDLIATDFSFLKDDKKQAVYSLMPMANHIRIDKEITAKENRKFSNVLKNNNYQGKMLKTLKEVFLDEISLKTTSRPFVINGLVANQGELKTLDMTEMLVYNYNNYLSETSNCFLLDLETSEQKRIFDSIGEYRFENSERSGEVLNRSVEEINNIFKSLNSDAMGERSTVEMFNLSNTDKYNETIAYRVEKIGGPPTGDSRTENVLQNFWF